MLPRHGKAGETGTRLDRITAFTDGVFAVAITLLVLDLRIAAIPSDRVGAALPGALRDLLPNFLSYCLSFAIIATYWIAHHRIFGLIARYDRVLVRLNLLFLFCISLVPFTTSLDGSYGTQRIAFTLYATNLAATGAVMTTLWRYATFHKRLVSPDLDPRAVRYLTLRGLVVPITALIGIGLSLISPENANYAWFLVIPLFFAIGRRYRREERAEEDDEFGADE
jgi:uncharacterized membrane protein